MTGGITIDLREEMTGGITIDLREEMMVIDLKTVILIEEEREEEEIEIMDLLVIRWEIQQNGGKVL